MTEMELGKEKPVDLSNLVEQMDEADTEAHIEFGKADVLLELADSLIDKSQEHSRKGEEHSSRFNQLAERIKELQGEK